MRLDLAADAEVVCAALSARPVTDWRTSLDRFAEATADYAELQISLPRRRVALVTLGCGPGHARRISAQLRDMGVAAASRRAFAAAHALAPDATWGVKLGIAGPATAQVYVRRPLPVDRVLDALALHGVDSAARRWAADAAALLERRHVHFLGIDLTPQAPPAFELYFTQHVDTGDPAAGAGARIAGLFGPAGVPAAQQALFAGHHADLCRPGQTLWVSVGVTAGGVLPGIKVDYAGAGMSTAVRLAVALHMPPGAMTGLERLQHATGVTSASYLGWRLQEHPSMSLYFTRRTRSPRHRTRRDTAPAA